MTELCIINTVLGCAFGIQDYVLYGIILGIIGILMAVFIPFDMAKKIGFGIFGIGLIMAILFPLIVGWWKNVAFQAMVYGAVIFIIIMMILFPGMKVGIGGKKK